ncbi:MAG: hypothetical protein AB1813_01335 [Verrucomicrobiota bacterium]|jgi:hypothetical protein
MTTEAASSRRSSRFKKSALIGLYSFIFYVLSFGPAVRIFNHTENELLQQAIVVVYTPLMWLRWKLYFAEPLEWYLGLWNG